MKVRNLVLLSESSKRNFAADNTESGSGTLAFAFDVVDAPEGRDWPYELTVNAKVFPVNRGAEAVFTTDFRYALWVDECDGEFFAPEAFAGAWPFVRGDLVERLRRYDMSVQSVPLSVSFEKSNDAQAQ